MYVCTYHQLLQPLAVTVSDEVVDDVHVGLAYPCIRTVHTYIHKIEKHT